ncbi:TKL/TKL-ccin protein kinase [Coprinopsis sp. MPI-PUGE-AT-0042]|nr:TKL/TKL-ccin protein kinase [Coprinopsis sp. MPI-PUGE-AT-0042]
MSAYPSRGGRDLASSTSGETAPHRGSFAKSRPSPTPLMASSMSNGRVSQYPSNDRSTLDHLAIPPAMGGAGGQGRSSSGSPPLDTLLSTSAPAGRSPLSHHRPMPSLMAVSSEDQDKLHTHRGSFLSKARRLSSASGLHVLPEAFRPLSHVFPPHAIRRRPWERGESQDSQSSEGWCISHTIPPEHAEELKKTEKSVIEAIKSVTMFSVEVVIKILESGILEYVPIPGLSIVAKCLVRIWNVVQGISNNRLRLLRLTERCAHVLLTIKRDVELAGERIHVSLQDALLALELAFDKVRLLAESQVQTPFLQRLIGNDATDEDFAACDEELNNALRMFSISVQISTMKLVLDTTDELRHQNEELIVQNQHLYALCNSSLSARSQDLAKRSPSPQISPVYPERRTSLTGAMSPGSFDRRRSSPGGSVMRPTASSRNKQVILPKHNPDSPSPPTLRTMRRTSNHSTSKDNIARFRMNEDPIEKIQQHQRFQNAIDQLRDDRDEQQLVKDTLGDGKDYHVLELLQIATEDYPAAISFVEDHLKRPHCGGRVDGEHLALRLEALSKGLAAMKRATKEADLIRPKLDWGISKYGIRHMETIGTGAFSTVRRVIWDGKVAAMKILSPTTKRSVFENELNIWKSLDHPNILTLHGGSEATEKTLFFLSPYLQHGNLVDFLHAIRDKDLEGYFRPILRRLTNPARYQNSTHSQGMRRQAHFNQFHEGGYRHEVDLLEPFASLPLSCSESKFNHSHILEEGDLWGFMVDIAKGMQYLHENGVLHGDLKASNVLVDDGLVCVISDFGQSERRNDIYRASGWTPKGTARWKAPEMLSCGKVELTPAADVYAYAITCIEVLSMGDLPWGSADDAILAHRIINDDLRPAIPPDFRNPMLEQQFARWWHKEPARRGDFGTIVLHMEVMLKGAGVGALPAVRRRLLQLQLQHATSPSLTGIGSPSDFSPRPLDSPLSSPSSPAVYQSRPELSGVGRCLHPSWVSKDFSDLQSPPSSLPSGPTSESSVAMPIPMLPSPYEKDCWEPAPAAHRGLGTNFGSAPFSSLLSSSVLPSTSTVLQASDFDQLALTSDDPSTSSYVEVAAPGSESPSLAYAGNVRCDEVYRHVRHDFHSNLRVPLWNPVLVEVGDVGYIDPTSNTFVTLFNAFEPIYATSPSDVSIPSIMGFGDTTKKQMKIPTQKSKKLFRTFTYKVEVHAGRPAAHCFCESPDWHYLEDIHSPQTWFKASVDSILKLHGKKHNIVKQDLLLVVGSLQASRYSLYISMNHPSGTVEFSGNSSKRGKPWGSFSPISIHRSGSSGEGYLAANRVSEVGASQKALFLAALHFPPNSSEPTLK